MAWSIGINFRATSGYVADGSGETYCIGDTYPTTRGGATFGWTSGLSGSANRSSGNDRRLAGINYRFNGAGSQASFRVDLPTAGTYLVRLALGDAGSVQGSQYLQIRDNGTARLTINDTDGTLSNNFDDVLGTNYAAAAWPGSNGITPILFTSTIAQFVIGTPTGGINASTLAHLFLQHVPAGCGLVGRGLCGHSPLISTGSLVQ